MSIKRKTIFSPCRKYRYTLWRDFTTVFQFDGDYNMKDGFVQFIGLNPSTADETQDDPTIRRCIGFAKSWGFSGMCMTNLFAFRATDPIIMKAEKMPDGIDNQHWLIEVAEQASLIVVAWGRHGLHNDQGELVYNLLCDNGFCKIRCLGTNADGTPKHPLYLSKCLKPIIYNP